MLGLAVGLTRRRSGGGGPIGRTYEDFQAHIATLATAGSTTTNGTVAAGSRRMVAAVSGGDLYGSSWLARFILTIGTFGRAVQHGMPSQSVWDAQVAAGREVYFVMDSSGATTPTVGASRNGYTSLGDEGTATGRMTDLIYWDGTQALRMNPFAGTGPTPYTW